MKALLGVKLGMLQVTKDSGEIVPVTLIQAGPCVVTQIKTTDVDGYEAVQLGYGEARKTGKSRRGHLKNSKANSRVLREFRSGSSEFKVGDKLDVDSFELGDKVKVSATSKGKGFAGTIKRHNFLAGPKSHGSKNVRQPGSIGSMYPQKVFRGKKMAGHMGAERVSTTNLEVAFINKDKHLIGVRGSVPGPKKALVEIRG